MQTVEEFAAQFPQYGFDFAKPMGSQWRILDPDVLSMLPLELAPVHEYKPGGRGRASRNQTLTHFQCPACKRVLRNDLFHISASMVRHNVLGRCRECMQVHNVNYYKTSAKLIQDRRTKLWNYIAPACVFCGFDAHPSALDLHHLGGKESSILALVAALAQAPDANKAQVLLREAKRCLPLCCNCHRMLHSGFVKIPAGAKTLDYDLSALMKLLE